MSRLKMVLTIVVATCGLILILQNTTPVEAKLLFVSFKLSLTVLLLLAMGIGFVLGLATALFKSTRSTKSRERDEPPK